MAALNDVLILNAEIAAMVRAGIPLELGLRRLSQTVSGRLSKLASGLLQRLERGEALPMAIQAESDTVSPLYAAVIEAGLRSGNLPAALDGLVEFGRALQETRRRVQIALIYPMTVAVLTYGLSLFLLLWVIPATLEQWDPLSESRNRWLQNLELLRATAIWWAPALPLLVLLGLWGLSTINRNWRGLQFVAAEPGGRGLLAGMWIPGLPPLYRDLDRAHVAQMLGLLLQHHVPLPTALELVSRLAGESRLRHALQQIAAGIAAGGALSDELQRTPELPLLLTDLLRCGDQDRNLPAALANAADIFRRRADRRMLWLRATLVPTFAFVFGGGLAILYALLFAFPLRWLYDELASL